MTDKAIIVDNLSKQYRIGIEDEVHDTLSASILSWIKSPLKNFRKIQILRDTWKFFTYTLVQVFVHCR